MWQYKHTDELYHYGVLGMKWGQRKRRVPSEDHVKSRELRKKKTSEMSTAELKKLNDRLTAENNYKENLKREKGYKFSPIKTAAAFVSAAGTIGGLYTIYTKHKPYVDKLISDMGDKLLKKVKLDGPIA